MNDLFTPAPAPRPAPIPPRQTKAAAEPVIECVNCGAKYPAGQAHNCTPQPVAERVASVAVQDLVTKSIAICNLFEPACQWNNAGGHAANKLRELRAAAERVRGR